MEAGWDLPIFGVTMRSVMVVLGVIWAISMAALLKQYLRTRRRRYGRRWRLW